MSKKPLIGINLDFKPSARTTPAYGYLAAGYFQCVADAGAIPMVLPPSDDPAVHAQIVDTLDGIVMIGGGDLDPRNDGFMMHPSVRPMDPRRETSDRLLMHEVAERRLPVFAIGTGMQLLNLEMGGNLFLHIREDLPEAICHLDPQDPQHRHTLIVEGDSVVGRVFGDGEIRVTSRHHMAVDDVAPGFRVTAKCPDGVIEAIESEMLDWFAMGVQFHPESSAASALDMRLFEEFVEHIESLPRSSSTATDTPSQNTQFVA